MFRGAHCVHPSSVLHFLSVIHSPIYMGYLYGWAGPSLWQTAFCRWFGSVDSPRVAEDPAINSEPFHVLLVTAGPPMKSFTKSMYVDGQKSLGTSAESYYFTLCGNNKAMFLSVVLLSLKNMREYDLELLGSSLGKSHDVGSHLTGVGANCAYQTRQHTYDWVSSCPVLHMWRMWLRHERNQMADTMCQI